MTANMTQAQKGQAEGLQFVTLPASVARMLAEAAWWPCILAGLPQESAETRDGVWGPFDDALAEAIRERKRELILLFGKAEIQTRTITGSCLPDDFLFNLTTMAGGDL